MADASCSSNTNLNDEKDVALSKGNSAKARLNQTVLESLQVAVKANPKVDLLSELPHVSKAALFEHEYSSKNTSLSKQDHPRKGKPRGPANFCVDLVARVCNAEIVYALSDEARNILSSYTESEWRLDLTGSSLVSSLCWMILSCERLWEFPTRGVVLKCNANLAAKIIRGNDDYTEYTSIQYLAKFAPEVPAPRPHGLVKFDSVRIIFMTYIPSMTLEAAWPGLVHEDEISIQYQLNEYFIKLRSLKWDGQFFGGVNGEGVQYHQHHLTRGTLSTVAHFEDFQFSVPPYDGSSWVKFYRSLLPPAPQTAVFTHGDVRPANIMVDIDGAGSYLVTDIINWETSGFYPAYFESVNILYILNDTDWCEYLPPCIAPANNPERWLVGRSWDRVVNGY